MSSAEAPKRDYEFHWVLRCPCGETLTGLTEDEIVEVFWKREGVGVAEPFAFEEAVAGGGGPLLQLACGAVGAEVSFHRLESRPVEPRGPEELARLGAGVVGPDEGVAWFVFGGEAEMLPATLLEEIAEQVVFVESSSDDHERSGARVVEAGADRL